MIQNKIEEKRRNTIDFQSFGMLLLFFLLLPYTVSILFGSNGEKETSIAKNDTSNESIVCETAAGIEYIPLETYIIGAVAASIDSSYEEEMIKAQAIMIRTICKKAVEAYGDEKHNVAEDKIALEYWSKETTKLNYEKIQNAVQDTKDMCLVHEGMLIEAAFCGLSNGNTRDGVEILGEGYDYLPSVVCEDAVLVDQYLQKNVWKKKDFMKKLKELVEEQQKQRGKNQTADTEMEKNMVDAQTEEITVIVDSMDYVVSVMVGDVEIAGETFRKEFAIISSDFQMEEIEGEIIITTKGIGHGFGVDQYQGNEMAKEGKNFFEILSYFYQDIEIAKNV